MLVINNNELFTQVAAEESSIASGGCVGTTESSQSSSMPSKPGYDSGWKGHTPHKYKATSAVSPYENLLVASGIAILGEALGIEAAQMKPLVFVRALGL